MRKNILFLTVLLLFLAGCKDNNLSCENGESGVLKNLTGLDGCGWIIELDDSSRIDPINLDDFDIALVENKSVCIQYHVKPDLASTCMVGIIVEIDEIKNASVGTDK